MRDRLYRTPEGMLLVQPRDLLAEADENGVAFAISKPLSQVRQGDLIWSIDQVWLQVGEA